MPRSDLSTCTRSAWTRAGSRARGDLRAFPEVRAACVAYNAGDITLDELTEQLCALPILQQAPLPDAAWYDAILINDGPISRFQESHHDRLVTGAEYEHVINAMLDAGHKA